MPIVTRVTDLLGCRHPIQQAGMGGVATPDLAIAVAPAGGLGVLSGTLGGGGLGVRVGTRFIAAAESTAHPVYVDALIGATADDTVLTTAFGDGWPDATHRVLKSSIEAGERLGPAQSWTPDWPAAGYSGAAEARAL